MKSDRYHVIQKWRRGRPDYAYDEWVTLGSEHYDNAAVWVKSPPGSGRAELNPAFRADKYLSILRTEEPRSAGLYNYVGRRYFLLEHESSTLGNFARFSRSLKGPVHISMWIEDTGLLAKGELAAWNTEPPGKQAPFELEQVFAGYGLDIQISAPQVGGTLTPRAQLMTLQDVGNFMQTYYLDPRPELTLGVRKFYTLARAHWIDMSESHN